MSCFFSSENSHSFRCFQSDGEFIPDPRHSDRKARLPKLIFALGTISYCESDLTRFNKIAIPNNKFQMASGQGSHWLIDSPTIFSSMCSPPLSNICQFYF